MASKKTDGFNIHYYNLFESNVLSKYILKANELKLYKKWRAIICE